MFGEKNQKNLTAGTLSRGCYAENHTPLNREKIQRKEESLMQETDGFKPFFKNKKVTNAVLTVFKCVDGGLDVDKVIEYSAIQYGCDPEEIRHYWHIMQNRWISGEVHATN